METNSSALPPSESQQKFQQSVHGQWTSEEEIRLIEQFYETLPIPNGKSILNCSTMNISKKFIADDRLGKVCCFRLCHPSLFVSIACFSRLG
jgi:hypothetical protein